MREADADRAGRVLRRLAEMAEADEKNSDFPMPQYAGGKGRPAPRLLVLHDDAEREFDYTAGAEKSLEQAAAGG